MVLKLLWFITFEKHQSEINARISKRRITIQKRVYIWTCKYIWKHAKIFKENKYPWLSSKYIKGKAKDKTYSKICSENHRERKDSLLMHKK